jgi:choice-of-anchor B domain-containing protein
MQSLRHYFLFTLFFALFTGAAHAQNSNITLRSTLSFQNQTLANICGYAAAGREYALVGGSKGMVIVDVTNPDAIVNLVQIPGPNNLWKEIKTYKNYAYITSEGGGGVQIVDLTNLPATNLTYHNYKGNGAIANQLETIHALHIDVTKGFLYAYGSALFNGGAVVLDLNADPYNPTYAGKFDQLGYIHDGYVDNDTMYSSHIYTGQFAIVNMADKNNPVLLGTQTTPNAFTHNTWISDDRKTIFATDETPDSFLSAYDVSDPTDIKFLDKVQSNPGGMAAVHNTHIVNNYAVTSWYHDGFTIVDVSDPYNMVQVGNYDTYPQATGPGFEGCWGVYPYLPSGTLLATNISESGGGKLYVLSPNYQRACYLGGLVTDAITSLPILGAKISLTNGDPNANATTESNGKYKTGQAASGTFNVTISKVGYLSATFSVDLTAGQTTIQDAVLTPSLSYVITGNAIATLTSTGVANAKIQLAGDDITYDGEADADGNFIISGVYPGVYDVIVGKWGYKYGTLNNKTINSNESFTVSLDKGYRDDFVFDYGWAASGTSVTGIWVREEPLGINPGIQISPETDQNGDNGDKCYVTGNSTNEVGFDDVNDGTSILTSPVMDLSTYNDPSLLGSIWCTHFTQNQESFDSIKVYISNGSTEKLIFQSNGFNTNWQIINKKIKPLITLTNNMTVKIVCANNYNGPVFDTYEAAFDFFRITDSGVSPTENLENQVSIKALPNPFSGQTQIAYDLIESGFNINVYDLSGKMLESRQLNDNFGLVSVGNDLVRGIYFVKLEKNGITAKTIKIVKVD